MPFLAAFIGSLFTAALQFFAQFMTRKLALLVSGLVAIAAVTTTFFAALNGLLVGIQAAMPSAIVIGYNLFIPRNLDECIAAVISAHLLAWAYSWNVRIIQWKLF